MTRHRPKRPLIRALVAGALLASAGAMAGDVTLFSGRDFTGDAMTVRGPAPVLSRIGSNDTASSIVVRAGTWEVCSDAEFRGRCVQLQPGEYSSLGLGFDDRIASAREIVASTAPAVAPVATAPLRSSDGPRLVLYELAGFGGRSVELNDTTLDLDRVRFGDRADSAVVVNGVWRLCEAERGRGDCVEMGPGRYDTLGALTNRVQSAELLMAGLPAPAPVSEGRAVLYQYPNFGGRSIVIDRSELPRLDAAFFKGGAQSIRVESGQWMFCRDADYAGECRTFGPGSYTRLPWNLGHVASGRQLPQRYSLLR